jgi:phosphoglycolate phosphatase
MRGILFDKDGTLIDFHASWSRLFRELCLDLAEGDGRRADAMLRQGGMDPETGIVRAGSVFAAGNSVDIVNAWYPELSGTARTGMVERIDQVFYENGIRYSVPIPGVKETLARLAEAGMTMGVATSDGTAGTRAALAVLGMQTYLPHVFGYDSVAAPKPAPDIVFAFAEAMGAHPEEIAVIGDNTHDLEMARRAGAGAAIGVLSGTGKAEDLAPLADAILDSVRDLPGWLETRGGAN